MVFERLTAGHLPLVDAFSCVESPDILKQLDAKMRRRIKHHSAEMDHFLQNEAYSEQELSMNTTYVAMDDDHKEIMAYISLCADAINLKFEERENEGVVYSSAPAVKIARLAVSNKYTHRGIGKMLIEFAAYQAQLIREHTGVFFLTLDCYEHRVTFYQSIGFVRNLVQPVVLQYDSPVSMRIRLDAYLERIANS